MQRQPPDIPTILSLLAGHDVDFVLIGSVAVQAWGVDVGVPGDLDIVPEPSRENLSRLAGALREMRAESWPITGRWVTDERGERDWEHFTPDHPDYLRRLPPPDPADISTFDSMYSTEYGDFDIVPNLTGTYDELAPRAKRLTVAGVPDVLVASVEDLLARLTVPRRQKDHIVWRNCGQFNAGVVRSSRTRMAFSLSGPDLRDRLDRLSSDLQLLVCGDDQHTDA